MRNMLLALPLALGLSLTATVAPMGLGHVPTAHAKKPDTARAQVIVINLKHGTDDLHAALMALKLGVAMAEKGADVHLFLNLEAVRLASKQQPLDLTWGPGDAKLETLFSDFATAGGKTLVCPHCAVAAGLAQEDLRDGLTIAEASEVVDLMIAADKVLDY